MTQVESLVALTNDQQYHELMNEKETGFSFRYVLQMYSLRYGILMPNSNRQRYWFAWMTTYARIWT
jgi:hypothetical protein